MNKTMWYCSFCLNSTNTQREFDLNTYTTKQDVLKAIDNVRQETGDANTHEAVDEMTFDGFSESNGARQLACGYRRVGILLTAGQSNAPNKTISAAARARDADVKMIVVGIGKNLCLCELEAIASEPNCQNLIVLENVTERHSLTHVILHRIREGK